MTINNLQKQNKLFNTISHTLSKKMKPTMTTIVAILMLTTAQCQSTIGILLMHIDL